MTKITNSLPSSCTVKCGVPQKSILDPILFTLYINDLPGQVTDGSTYLYANDTAITVNGLNSYDIEGNKFNVMSSKAYRYTPTSRG